MITLNDCLTKDTRIVLMKPEEEKKRFSFFRHPKEKKIYRKNFNHAEFVGEDLCAIRNLRCAHYFLIGEGSYKVNYVAKYGEMNPSMYDIKLGSYDFKDSIYKYFDLNNIGTTRDGYSDWLTKILSMVPTEENREELLDEIEEMFALDTFMGQTDRIKSNIMFEQNCLTGEIHLAPLYDFQYSLRSGYCDPKCLYGNPLHIFDTVEEYQKFILEHPDFRDKLMSYLDVDLLDSIRRGYRAKGVIAPENVLCFYDDFQNERKQIIDKITRTR